MNPSRRNILAGLSSLPLLNIPKVFAEGAPRRVLRIAYFTDIHLPPIPEVNKRAEKAFAKARNCDLFLFGGDNVMAIDHKPEADILAHYDNWASFTKANLHKPFRCILGNHDVEQWPEGDDSPAAGKKRPIEFFGMKNRYWTENIEGWRILALDTVHRHENSFYGFLDQEQLGWLDEQMKDTRTPTLALGHMPLLSVTALADSGLKVKDNTLPISCSSEVSNAREAISRFRKAGNIKLCLSGHTHMIDRCDYAGTSYICAGAVCGGWWNGANQGFPPAYFEIDLMSDGTFQTRTIYWED